MKQLTFLELAKKVLQEEKRPLSSEEIWAIAVEKDYAALVGSSGKTPPQTIGALIYVDMRDNSESPFIKLGTRPRRFSLNGLLTEQQAQQILAIRGSVAPEKPSYKEVALHAFLAYFANHTLKAYTKTIVHIKSTKREFGEWVHPDMVGCYLPFDDSDWSEVAFDFSTAIGSIAAHLYSFELKRRLDFVNLREAFFQTVSNSSWANEGYLAAAEISEDTDFLTELQRLSTSFGIGVIKLDVENPNSSAILYPARVKDYLDWDMINKLASMNADFQEFLRRIKTDLTSREVRKEKYDHIASVDELIASIRS